MQASRKTIVVVDDNDDHRDLMTEILNPLGFIVLTAAGGVECLTLIEACTPDLFFVDIQMPGMNGWELVGKLREQGSSAPILMLSANIGDGANAGNADSGHNDTIAKPFDLKQLMDKLQSHLKLQWIYDDEQERSASHKGNEAPAILKSPGAAHLRELVQLGEIGYIRGIEQKLADLVARSFQSCFYRSSRPLCAGLRYDGICTLSGADEGQQSN